MLLALLRNFHPATTPTASPYTPTPMTARATRLYCNESKRVAPQFRDPQTQKTNQNFLSETVAPADRSDSNINDALSPPPNRPDDFYPNCALDSSPRDDDTAPCTHAQRRTRPPHPCNRPGNRKTILAPPHIGS